MIKSLKIRNKKMRRGLWVNLLLYLYFKSGNKAKTNKDNSLEKPIFKIEHIHYLLVAFHTIMFTQ